MRAPSVTCLAVVTQRLTGSCGDNRGTAHLTRPAGRLLGPSGAITPTSAAGGNSPRPTIKAGKAPVGRSQAVSRRAADQTSPSWQYVLSWLD